MRYHEIMTETEREPIRTPDDIDSNAKVDIGVLYRGVETGPDATQALRQFSGGDLGDGIYLTPVRSLAGSYGGGPKASVRAGTRTVHAYRVAPLFGEDVVYLFGGSRHNDPVRLISGNGIELWRGGWSGAAIEKALSQHGGVKLVIGTANSVGVNQVAVRDRSILVPEPVDPERMLGDVAHPSLG